MNQKTPDDSRKMAVKLSLSQDELIAIHEAAKEQGLTRGEWIRSVIRERLRLD